MLKKESRESLSSWKLSSFFGNAYRLLEKLPTPFDLIYIDPPYATSTEEYVKLLHFFDDEKKIATGARLIIEENRQLEEVFTSLPLAWLHYEGMRRYGSSSLQLFRTQSEPPTTE